MVWWDFQLRYRIAHFASLLVAYSNTAPNLNPNLIPNSKPYPNRNPRFPDGVNAAATSRPQFHVRSRCFISRFSSTYLDIEI